MRSYTHQHIASSIHRPIGHHHTHWDTQEGTSDCLNQTDSPGATGDVYLIRAHAPGRLLTTLQAGGQRRAHDILGTLLIMEAL